jgi:hypothetical protein
MYTLNTQPYQTTHKPICWLEYQYDGFIDAEVVHANNPYAHADYTTTPYHTQTNMLAGKPICWLDRHPVSTKQYLNTSEISVILEVITPFTTGLTEWHLVDPWVCSSRLS